MIQERRFNDLCDLNTWKFDYEYPIISIRYSDRQYIVLYDNCYNKRDGCDFWGHYCCYPEREESNPYHSITVAVNVDADGGWNQVTKDGYYDYHSHKWMVGSAEEGYKSVADINNWSYYK